MPADGPCATAVDCCGEAICGQGKTGEAICRPATCGATGDTCQTNDDCCDLRQSCSGTGGNKTCQAPPKRLNPVTECVSDNGDGTFTAYFGYQSTYATAVNQAVGGKNKISPGNANRGQPAVFQPGRQQRVFSVVFDGNALVWTLSGPNDKGGTATASRTSAVCAS